MEDGLRLIAIDLAASGFLRHMVRTIVGTLVLIGRGKLRSEQMTQILQSRDRAQAGPTAPPHGLYLMSVTYPDELDKRPAGTT
jgi:tRNA pseudouridine38-40 synthase